jgi:hypothetical protein
MPGAELKWCEEEPKKQNAPAITDREIACTNRAKLEPVNLERT